GVDESEATDIDRVIGAAIDGDEAQFRRLLRTSPDVKSRLREDDLRMLAWAIRTERYHAVPLLLDAGFDPNVPDRDGETPLHLAVRANSVEVLDVLLKAGAGTDVRNFDGETPMDLAIAHRDDAARQGLIKCLLRFGARPAHEAAILDRDEMNVLF